MKKMNKKGFTMAELLIVVAIIAVLVAIAIPVFTTQLEKSRCATDIANFRSSYSEAVANALADNKAGTGSEYKANHTNQTTFEAAVDNTDMTDAMKTEAKKVTIGSTIKVSVDKDGKITDVAPTTTTP